VSYETQLDDDRPARILLAAIQARECILRADYILRQTPAQASWERDAAIDGQLQLAMVGLDELIEALRQSLRSMSNTSRYALAGIAQARWVLAHYPGGWDDYLRCVDVNLAEAQAILTSTGTHQDGSHEHAGSPRMGQHDA